MKVIGLISLLAGVGLIVISKVDSLLSKFGFISQSTLTYAGMILFVLGLAILIANRSSLGTHATKEVPIYQGNKIVGYRRA